LVAALLVLGAKPTTAGSPPGVPSSGPDTFWLDFTNIALGLVTLEACLWVAWGVAREAIFRRRLRRVAVTASRGLVLLVTVALVPRPAEATVEMQNQAKKLGFEVHNCVHCHATPHAVEKMKEKAKVTGMAEGNCLACHGANIPITLNHRGEWLVAEKARRAAKECDMAWLKDYKESAPTPMPAAPKASTEKSRAKPETIQVAPKP
jgi:mono/diheme cytochrome c family protein